MSFNGIRKQNEILFISKLKWPSNRQHCNQNAIQHFIHFIGLAIMELPFVVFWMVSFFKSQKVLRFAESTQISHTIPLNTENNYHQKVNADVWMSNIKRCLNRSAFWKQFLDPTNPKMDTTRKSFIIAIWSSLTYPKAAIYWNIRNMRFIINIKSSNQNPTSNDHYYYCFKIANGVCFFLLWANLILLLFIIIEFRRSGWRHTSFSFGEQNIETKYQQSTINIPIYGFR